MAKTTFLSWSTTAGNNTDIDSIGILGSNAVNNFDDAFRTIMAQLRRDIDGRVVYASKSSNYTALADDNNTWHRFTSTATVSLTAAATLGANWHYYVQADGAVVTIDPNAAELINGAATLVLQSGQTASIICTGSAFIAVVEGTVITGPGQQGYLYGLTLSNNASDATNDIDIATGVAAADTSPYSLMQLTSGITKRLDAAWAVGTGNGGLDTGAIANATYHLWLIQRSDTGVVDALFSTSATAPTMPTNYDRKRRIGGIVRSSGSIQAFTQRGDTFKWAALPLSFSAAGSGAAALTITAIVPDGIVVEALINVNLLSASGNTCYISDLTSTDLAPSAQVATVGGTATSISGSTRVFTNTSRQFRARMAVGSATETINISTAGWVDTRGRT